MDIIAANSPNRIGVQHGASWSRVGNDVTAEQATGQPESSGNVGVTVRPAKGNADFEIVVDLAYQSLRSSVPVKEPLFDTWHYAGSRLAVRRSCYFLYASERHSNGGLAFGFLAGTVSMYIRNTVQYLFGCCRTSLMCHHNSKRERLTDSLQSSECVGSCRIPNVDRWPIAWLRNVRLHSLARCIAVLSTIWLLSYQGPALALDGEQRCIASPSRSCVVDLAVQAISEIEDTSTRYSYLEDLVQWQIASGTIEDALETSRLIDDLQARLRAIRPLSYLVSEDAIQSTSVNRLVVDEVLSLEDHLRALNEDADSVNSAVLNIARFESASRAIDEAAAIELAGRRAETLIEIAAIAFDAGNLLDSESALASAWEALADLPGPLAETGTLLRLIRTHLQYGDDQDVVSSALTIQSVQDRVYALMFIADQQFELGDNSESLDTLALARDEIVQNSDSAVGVYDPGDLLGAIASQQRRFGDSLASEATFQLAIEARPFDLDQLQPLLPTFDQPLNQTVPDALGMALRLDDTVLRALALLILVTQSPGESIRID